jgi:type II restriction enzyme
MKGNKGEWSELYAFFELLAKKRLFSADEHLNKANEFVEIQSIFRSDSGAELNYNPSIDNTIVIVNGVTNEEILRFSNNQANEIADRILQAIRNKMRVPTDLIEDINSLKIQKVADKTQGKGDIKIRIYDPLHGISSNQEFSIKSFLGSDPTLFNSNPTTNICYEIIDKNGGSLTDEQIENINNIDSHHKYIKRIAGIHEMGFLLNFHSFDDSTFKLNLELICSDLPEIIAFMVKDKYVNRTKRISDVIDRLNEVNPIGYDLSQGHRFYEYRIVNFLVEAAMGMTSKSVWSGKYDIVGGIIIIKPDSEMLCYHLIDFNKFRQYLRNSAKLDNPSGSKMGYGSVYKENERSFIKLNFQIKA